MDYLEELTKSLLKHDSPYIEEIKEKDKIINNLSKKKNILIVDDNIESLFILEVILKNLGHTLFRAENGVEAFDIFKKCHHNDVLMDIVFMDIRMPKLDGIECTKLIRQYEKENNLQPCKIIILTAYTDREKEARESGADNIMFKPISKKDITNEI